MNASAGTRPHAGSNRLNPPFSSVLDLIGDTPMVELKKFDTGKCRLFIKLESQNPGGSIKDRIARSMIDAAERDGTRSPRTIKRPCRNTGLGLARSASEWLPMCDRARKMSR